MIKNIFDFKDYRAYIRNRMGQLPRAGRGAKMAMAKAISCPTSHISQVLSGISHLSLEQAEAVNLYLGHTEDEGDYFLLLVQYSRAASPALSKRLTRQMDIILQKRLVLKDRLGVRAEISPVDQAKFYSSWIYGAIHVMVSIQKFQSRDAIARHIGISPKYVGEILDFLISIGLVVQNANGYAIGTSRIHLGHDSPMISKFHTNWRMKSIQSFEKEDFKNDLHYSSVITISDSDHIKIKSMLVHYIDEIKSVIRDSREEGLHCFSLDFFKI